MRKLTEAEKQQLQVKIEDERKRQQQVVKEPIRRNEDERRLSEGQKPPTDRARIIGEILAGGGAGVIVGIFGWLSLSLVHVQNSRDESLLPTILLFLGVMSGVAFVTSVGVYLVGNIGNETGSFSATLKSSILGISIVGGVCVVLMIRADIGSDEYGIEVFYFLVFALGLVIALTITPIIATIKFNSTRRYKFRYKK